MSDEDTTTLMQEALLRQGIWHEVNPGLIDKAFPVIATREWWEGTKKKLISFEGFDDLRFYQRAVARVSATWKVWVWNAEISEWSPKTMIADPAERKAKAWAAASSVYIPEGELLSKARRGVTARTKYLAVRARHNVGICESWNAFDDFAAIENHLGLDEAYTYYRWDDQTDRWVEQVIVSRLEDAPSTTTT